MSWSPDDPLFEELFRFALFLHGSREQVLQALERAFRKLSRRPEAAERERATRFLFREVRQGAPKAKVIETSEKAGIPGTADNGGGGLSSEIAALSAARCLREPERSLVGLFYATNLPAADISRILGLPPAELARRMCEVRRKLAPESLRPKLGDHSPKPGAGELRRALERPRTARADTAGDCAEFADEELLRQVDDVWFTKFHALRCSEQDCLHLRRWANDLQNRAAAWRPSLRDPAMIGLACALVLLIAILVWTLAGTGDAFHGRQKVLAILDEGVSAAAAEYEPVNGRISDLADWLVLQGMEPMPPPPGFSKQRAIAARIFPFESTRVATVLLPDSEMAAFFFDASAIGVEVKPQGEWKVFARGQDSAAILQRGRHAFMVAVRGTPEVLQKRIEAISKQ